MKPISRYGTYEASEKKGCLRHGIAIWAVHEVISIQNPMILSWIGVSNAWWNCFLLIDSFIKQGGKRSYAAKYSFSCDRRPLQLAFATALCQLFHDSPRHLTDRWRWDVAHSTRIHNITRIITVLARQWEVSDDTTWRNPLVNGFEHSGLVAHFAVFWRKIPTSWLDVSDHSCLVVGGRSWEVERHQRKKRKYKRVAIPPEAKPLHLTFTSNQPEQQKALFYYSQTTPPSKRIENLNEEHSNL